MDRTHQSTRKGFLKRASLSIAGALTLNNLAQARTPVNTLRTVSSAIEKPARSVQRAKGSVARSADV
jgi:hypothetical protein